MISARLVRLAAAISLVLLLAGAPLAAQVGRTKERPPAKPPAEPDFPVAKPRPVRVPLAPKEVWTRTGTFGPLGKSTLAVAWHPNGPLLAAGGAGGTLVEFRDVATGEVKGSFGRQMGLGWVRALAFERLGNALAVRC